MQKDKNITAIIIAKNEEEMIANCIETLSWCSEILVINNNSFDKTEQLAENLGARVINFASSDFSKIRNEGLKRAKTDWVFYVDADERVSPELAKEILVNIELDKADVFKINRQNICYGSLLKHGGWGQDQVTRVFRRKNLVKWQGEIHESPKYTGQVVELKQKLIHLTHRSTQANLLKSAIWTKQEAKLLYEAKVKKINFLLIIKKGLSEFIKRAVFKQGYKDGLTGLIESLVQALNKILIYIQVWEMQQRPELEKRYQDLETEIAKKWQLENKGL